MPQIGKRTWIRTLLVLMVLVPGFPVLMVVIGLLLAAAGLVGLVFMPALTLGNLYYSLPAVVFGSSFFPVKEFGYTPAFAGAAFAAVMYALIALVVSVPVARTIDQMKRRKVGN